MAATIRERELELENERLRQEIADLKAKVAKLEALLAGKAEAKSAKKPKFTENYGLGANEAKLAGRRRRKRRKKSPGRRRRAEKAHRATVVEDVYPPGVERSQCVLRAQQYAWRLIEGQAVYVRYDLYAPAESSAIPSPPGLRNRRCEFGLEIIVALAYLHYWIGMSIDNAREVMNFFTGLELSKSQANSLLSQLSRDWDDDYEAIATLISLQMLVYVDETGWKVGGKSCYTWAFSCAAYVLFRCGVGRGKEEAQAVLGGSFQGIGVTDDYGAYRSLFKEHQLCWAHLLRKAIKLALQYPGDPEHAKFLNKLYAIYRQAVRYRKDQRLSVGRAAKVELLKRRINRLCVFADMAVEEGMPEDVATMVRLHNELVDNLDALFTFVLRPEVEPTNNTSEHNVRRDAEVRKGGRTSKTTKGARRRSIIMTVFASLRTRIPHFTLAKVLATIEEWIAEGCSIFQRELAERCHSSAQARAAPRRPDIMPGRPRRAQTTAAPMNQST